MSKIRLHGSSSGYTEIAPVAASGNNTLTLPNDGTIISKDSNGAVGVTSITVGTGVTIGDGRVTCSTLHGSAASLTAIPAANLVGVCTAGFSDGVVGSYVHLNTTTVSSSVANITFDSGLITSTYKIFKIQFHGLKGTNNLKVQVSPDNGANYRTSGYVGARRRFYTSDGGSNFVTDTSYHNDSLYYSSVGTGDQMTQEVTITSIHDSSLKTACIALGGFGDSSAYHTWGLYGSRYNTAESHNNIRIVGGSGNFASGSVSLYGVKA